MKKILISVVIPITRYEFELSEALESVFNQTEKDFEVILVDNLATAGTKAVAQSWKSKFPDVVRVVQEDIPGAVSARNRGILESVGEYIAFLDSDDRMKPDRLKMQLDAINKDSGIRLVGAWKDEISPDGKTVVVKDSKPEIPRWGNILFGKTDRWKSEPFFEPQTSTFFFRKSTVQETGMFDLRFNPFWLEDTDFAFRMYEKGKVFIVGKSLIEYRQHSSSDSLRRIFDIGLIEKHNLFFSVLKEKYYLPGNRNSERSFRKLKSRWLRETGIKVLAFQNGEALGKELIKKSFMLNFLDVKSMETFFRTLLPSSFYPRAFGVKARVASTLPDYVNEEWGSRLFQL